MHHPVYSVVLRKPPDDLPMASNGSVISKSLDVNVAAGGGRRLSTMSERAKPVIPSINSKTVTTSTTVETLTAEKNSLQIVATMMSGQSQIGKTGMTLPPSSTLQPRSFHSRRLISLQPKPFYCGAPNWSGQRNGISEVAVKKHVGGRRSLPEIPQSGSIAVAEELINSCLPVSNCASSNWEFCLRCTDLPGSELALPSELSQHRIQSAVQVHKHLLPLLMFRMALSHRSIRQTWSQYETERMAKSIATKISRRRLAGSHGLISAGRLRVGAGRSNLDSQPMSLSQLDAVTSMTSRADGPAIDKKTVFILTVLQFVLEAHTLLEYVYVTLFINWSHPNANDRLRTALRLEAILNYIGKMIDVTAPCPSNITALLQALVTEGQSVSTQLASAAADLPPYTQ